MNDDDLYDVIFVYHKGNQRGKLDDGSDVVPGRGLKVVSAEFDVFPQGK